jgi:hypothetical protein
MHTPFWQRDHLATTATIIVFLFSALYIYLHTNLFFSSLFAALMLALLFFASCKILLWFIEAIRK